MRYKYLSIKGTVFLAIIFGLFSQLYAGESLKKSVDSLFVIASSGEVKYRDMVEPAMAAIVEIGEDAVPLLIDKFTTKSARERLTLGTILEKIGSQAVPELVKSLKHPNGVIVQRVCWALGRIKDSTATAPLIVIAGHSRWQVRDQAVSALGKIGQELAGNTIVDALDDTIGQVRKAAVVSAGKLKIEESIPQLVHILGDDFYGARMSAVHTLLNFDTSRVITVMADSSGSENHFVGDLACYILGEFGNDEAVELLYTFMDSKSPERRAHAAIALIKGDPSDRCGFHQALIENETDRFTLLKIESALAASRDGQ